MGELEPDAELSAEVESVFDRYRLAEVRIEVRLPGECMPDGNPQLFGYKELIPAAQIRLTDPYESLPPMIRRALVALVINMRFR